MVVNFVFYSLRPNKSPNVGATFVCVCVVSRIKCFLLVEVIRMEVIRARLI